MRLNIGVIFSSNVIVPFTFDSLPDMIVLYVGKSKRQELNIPIITGIKKITPFLNILVKSIFLLYSKYL